MWLPQHRPSIDSVPVNLNSAGEFELRKKKMCALEQ